MKSKKTIRNKLKSALLCAFALGLGAFGSGMLAPLGAAAATAPFSGGDGSPASPYLIATRSDLEALGNTSSQGRYFALKNDIELGDSPLAPIPTFGGHLDGRGYTLKGLTVETGIAGGSGSRYFHNMTHTGLFGYVQPGAVIENMRLTVNSVGGGALAGGLAGECDGTVRNCYVEIGGGILADTPYGMAAAYSPYGTSPTYIDCVTLIRPEATVAGQLFSSGITCMAAGDALIEGCYVQLNGTLGKSDGMGAAGIYAGEDTAASAQISNCAIMVNAGGRLVSGELAGAIAARGGLGKLAIDRCFSLIDGTLEAVNGGAGGIFAGGGAEITNCYSRITGSLTGLSSSGGITAELVDSSLRNSYVVLEKQGKIAAEGYSGGLAGSFGAKEPGDEQKAQLLANCYVYGAGKIHAAQEQNSGALVGSVGQGEVAGCYYFSDSDLAPTGTVADLASISATVGRVSEAQVLSNEPLDTGKSLKDTLNSFRVSVMGPQLPNVLLNNWTTDRSALPVFGYDAGEPIVKIGQNPAQKAEGGGFSGIVTPNARGAGVVISAGFEYETVENVSASDGVVGQYSPAKTVVFDLLDLPTDKSDITLSFTVRRPDGSASDYQVAITRSLAAVADRLPDGGDYDGDNSPPSGTQNTPAPLQTTTHATLPPETAPAPAIPYTGSNMPLVLALCGLVLPALAISALCSKSRV